MRCVSLLSGLGLLASLASAAEWKVLYNNVMTIAMGVDVTPSGAVYVSGSDDGTGAAILRSADNGLTWDNCPQTSLEMMYMDVAMGNDVFGVAGGIGMFGAIIGSAQTTDGNTWGATPGNYMVSAAQSVGARGNSTYFLVGIWQEQIVDPLGQGVRATFDGGKTLVDISVPVETAVRYGDFPSDNTWYLSCGYWPSTEKTTKRSKSRRDITENIRIFADKTGSYKFDINLGDIEDKDYDQYGAEILKTSDGGKTWQQVFIDYGNFYFNGISCPNENHCIVVGEGDDGGHILTTVDGGNTWQETYFGAGTSLFNVDMLNDKEGWAVGAHIYSQTFGALFLHTTDGGFTWTEAGTIDNAYPNAVVVVNSNLAYATAFLRNGLSSILVYN